MRRLVLLAALLAWSVGSYTLGAGLLARLEQVSVPSRRVAGDPQTERAWQEAERAACWISGAGWRSGTGC